MDDMRGSQSGSIVTRRCRRARVAEDPRGAESSSGRFRSFRPVCGSVIRTSAHTSPAVTATLSSNVSCGRRPARRLREIINPVSSPGAIPSEQPCLFCKRVGKPESVEHVFPQGLGVHADVTLPPGAVCAQCNNWLGRQVDEALVHLLEVQLIRGIFRVPDAAGNTVDSIPLSNGTLTFSPSGAIDVQVTSRRWLEERARTRSRHHNSLPTSQFRGPVETHRTGGHEAGPEPALPGAGPAVSSCASISTTSETRSAEHPIEVSCS
jgi:hypothetical protein